MGTWQPYDAPQHTVMGDLRVWKDFYSPQLDNQRDLFVWLPPNYERSRKRYPVIYMHDALNLFDKTTSYSGEWEVDETMTALASEGLEAIIVGLPNMKERRGIEYSPYPFQLGGAAQVGEGAFYIRFIVETVKPFIDQSFRTRAESTATGISGSSMGGLISLYGFVMYPHIFGLCGAFSTAYWFGENGLLETTRAHADGHGRVYLDVGTNEGETLSGWFPISGADADAAYTQGVRDLRDALIAKGYILGKTLMYVEDEGAMHREHAWAARFPSAMRFLLGTS